MFANVIPINEEVEEKKSTLSKTNVLKSTAYEFCSLAIAPKTSKPLTKPELIFSGRKTGGDKALNLDWVIILEA